jgi:protein-tyrosine phosphatase
MNAENITAILNCTGDSYEPPPGIELCTLSMPDNSECDPAIVWRGIDFIRKEVSDGGKVLVHCVAGISRSRALVAAYLHLHHGMSWESAKAEVLRKRAVWFGINKKTEATVLRALEQVRF